MSMKALRIYGPCDMRLEIVPIPELGPDDVLVEVGAVGICTTDIELYDGSMPYISQGLSKLPLIPGHEWAGKVAQVGSNVKGWEIGTPVIGDVSIGCGSCYNCLQGKYHICSERREVGIINHDGAFAEYIKISAKNIYRIPDGMTLEEAALVEPTATAVHGAMITGIRMGDSVAVFGDGSIGIQCAQAAKACGASKVVLIARKWRNKELLESMGITLINKLDQNMWAQIEKELGGMADVVFEATGAAEVITEAIHAVKAGGKICALSIVGQDKIAVDIDYLVTREITLVGSLASPNAFKATLDLIAAGKIMVKPLISKKFSLDEGCEAFDYVHRRLGPRIKVLVSRDI